ncbi:MAG: SurA N-terminal domain-containing protein [Clostridia bacterium]|nr:SurA N-terminal domain-containing protein [Clostridia bacterium]
MKKKKTIRNIVIAAAVVVVIVAAVILGIALRKDGHGMNAFERSRTAASANGVSVSMLEYALTFDTLAQSYSSSTLTDAQIKVLQDNAVNQALLQKIYTKEAKALGLTLTDEEVKSCKASAQEQIDGIVEAYTQQLVEGGSFSKAALDKQVASYYAMIGMTQGQYYDYCKERYESNAYMSKLEAYYEENGSGLSEDEVLAYYHESVENTMVDYTEGQYTSSLIMYAYGYSMPMLYVPEGFFYVDFIEVSKDTEAEVQEIFNKVIYGGKEDASAFAADTETEEVSEDTPKDHLVLEPLSFDELLESDDNVSVYRNIAEGPYAIGDNDYGYLFDTDAEAYEKAKALEIGQIGTFIKPVSKTDTDGNELITGYIGYMFRRAEGKMCEDGSNIIKIDYYPTIRSDVESGLRQKKWTSDITVDDAVYGYRGSLA